MTIRIIDIEGNVIFKYWRINNTIKKTLEKAVKKGVRLAKANLIDADLKGANLEGAELIGAHLTSANLYKANLKNAGLVGVSFCLVNLEGANFEGANLHGADFCYANLKNANFKSANLYNACFHYAMNSSCTIPMACPESGSFIGWKKVIDNGSYLVKLEIPADAKRCSATSKKCRCSKANVLEITNITTGDNVKEIFNFNFSGCLYVVGEMVYPDYFDENRWKECSHGIHFFMDKQDAIDY